MDGREGMRRRIVLVTGMSGAGMSSALSALEDLGHEAVDNLPLSLVPALVAQGDLSNRPIAIGIDSRTRGFDAERLLAELRDLRDDATLDVLLLFLDCDDEALRCVGDEWPSSSTTTHRARRRAQAIAGPAAGAGGT